MENTILHAELGEGQKPGPVRARLFTDCAFGLWLRLGGIRPSSLILGIVAWVACAGLALALRAESLTLQPVADTYLSEQLPDSNLGKGPEMVIGTQGMSAGATKNRGLIRFDLTGHIPPGSRIASVALRLSIVKVPSLGADSTFELRRVLQPWNETEATWNRSAMNAPWSAPGGAAPTDFSDTASAAQSVAGRGNYTFASTTNLIADLQSWVDNSDANFGWIVLTRLEDVEKTARRFASREGPTNAPALLIEYTAGQFQPLQMSETRKAGDRLIFQFNAQPQQTYSVELNNAMGTTNWQTLTNIAAQPVATNITVSDSLIASQRFYRVKSP